MVIDFHTHCFPARIAGSALDKLARNAGALRRFADGTLDGLKRHMAESRVDLAVVLNITTSPAQQRAVNDFAVSQAGEGIVPFGSVHPFAPDAAEELERIAAAGLKGVKFHPQFQDFAIDDPAVYRIYRKAASLGLVTVFHAGLDLGFEDSELASPEALARALPAFCGAPVVAAHLGGCMCWQDVMSRLAGLPVYFDTAFCHGHIPLPEAKRLIEMHGASRVLFGSDLPWSGMAGELDFISSLGLSNEDTEKILHRNAAGLLGIPQTE